MDGIGSIRGVVCWAVASGVGRESGDQVRARGLNQHDHGSQIRGTFQESVAVFLVGAECRRRRRADGLGATKRRRAEREGHCWRSTHGFRGRTGAVRRAVTRKTTAATATPVTQYPARPTVQRIEVPATVAETVAKRRR